jgi:rubrerythrin
MKREDMLDKLEKLIYLDIDATHAYDQAIKNVREQLIKDKLILFKSEHNRHIDLLSAKLREFGGVPPELTQDFKGYFITGFTALRSLTGTKGALNAMETNEWLTTSKYEEAVTWDFPADIATIVQSNLADEQRHLMFIREKLKLFRV